MFDARTFPQTLDIAQAILEKNGAVLKGDYAITNKIYKHKTEPLEKVFLRLRTIPKNIWNEGAIIVSIKNTEIKQVGKQSIISFKKEFDTEKEAEAFIEENYASDFTFDFEFSCIGWQYFLGEDGIDLELIENPPSIEFKSKTQQGLQNLLARFGVRDEEVIKGPSVVVLRKLLK
jgi:hypothetical protein